MFSGQTGFDRTGQATTAQEMKQNYNIKHGNDKIKTQSKADHPRTCAFSYTLE